MGSQGEANILGTGIGNKIMWIVSKLVTRYLESKMYTEALSLIEKLLKELKRLDDKNSLMEVQLLESRVYHALRNLPKARVLYNI